MERTRKKKTAKPHSPVLTVPIAHLRCCSLRFQRTGTKPRQDHSGYGSNQSHPDLRQPSGRPAGRRAGVNAPSPPTPQGSRWLANGSEVKIVGSFVIPKKATGLAGHANAKCILCARRNLACPDHALGTISEPEQDRGIVIQGPVRPESCQIGQPCTWNKTGHESCKVEGMGADIRDAPTGARLRRVGAPCSQLIIRTLDRHGQPVLQIPHLNLTDATDPAGRDKGPYLVGHRITGAGLGQGKGQASLDHKIDQRLSVFDGCGKRLLAGNGNSRAQIRRGHPSIEVNGRSDRHSAHPNCCRWPAPQTNIIFNRPYPKTSSDAGYQPAWPTAGPAEKIAALGAASTNAHPDLPGSASFRKRRNSMDQPHLHESHN